MNRKLLSLCTLAAAPIFAQNAEISGRVSDPSNLPVPNARLTAQRAATGVTRTVASNQQGEFSLPALLPGSYDISVEAAGFKTIQQKSVVLEVDQRARV